MIDEKKKELLKKLKRLSEQGVDGEKKNAERKLQELMEKFGIKDLDLTEEISEYSWQFHDTQEQRLLRQVLYKVLGEDWTSMTYRYTTGKGARTTWYSMCTASQAAQINVEYEFYVDLWKEESDFLLKCFINKHDIFPQCDSEEVTESTMTGEELLRMQLAMDSMQDKSLTQRIG